MLTCHGANALIVRTLDDARLSGGERAALRWHLASCARCRLEYETQHEVRRLLVLHIQDPLPAGFDERLNAQLAQTARSLPGGVVADTEAARAMPAPAPFVDPRRLDVGDAWRGGMRRRTWALRLGPLAAAVLLFALGASVYDAPPQAPSSLPASVAGAAPEEPRTFTTIVLPRPERASRRHQRTPSVSPAAGDLARVPVRPMDEGRWQGGVAAAVGSGTAIEHASKAPNDAATTAVVGGRASASEPLGQERERVASRERGEEAARAASGELEAGDEQDVRSERASSQRPGVLPRPAGPFPRARPAMPAPPAALPDRPLPPW